MNGSGNSVNNAVPQQEVRSDEAPTYEPLPPSPKRRPAAAAKKRNLVELMGVGAFLASVQREEAERRQSPASGSSGGGQPASSGNKQRSSAKRGKGM